ncbi:hypothetical protein KP78_29280 [Jeotgalibacillus soli]|uniref:Uncharacterized protein n=1 Tax=Jeotgalibacillus soli TaxID=889306 RepID=A0A0C2RUG5_9BACL|nr:hypothetical protein KP78_29280 [Jeotgalibacillus soli]
MGIDDLPTAFAISPALLIANGIKSAAAGFSAIELFLT